MAIGGVNYVSIDMILLGGHQDPGQACLVMGFMLPGSSIIASFHLIFTLWSIINLPVF